MKSCIDLTSTNEGFDQDSLDDTTMEVAEIMAKSLPDVENVNRSLKKSSKNDKRKEIAKKMSKSLSFGHNVNCSMENSFLRGKHPTIDGKNGTTIRGENEFPINEILINNFPFEGNSFGMNNLHSSYSPSGFILSSSGVHISRMDTNQLGSAQTSMFNQSIRGIRSLNTSLNLQGYVNDTCNIGAPLSLNNAFLEPRMIVSHPSSNNTNMTFLSSGHVNKQSKEREFDLNIPYYADNDKVGTSSKAIKECQFYGQHNGIGHYTNQEISFDLNDNDTTCDINLLNLDLARKKYITSLNARINKQMPQRTLYPSEFSNTILDIGSSKKSFYPCISSIELDIGKSKTCESPESQSLDSHKESSLSDKSQGLTIFDRKIISPFDLGDQNMSMTTKEQMNSSGSFMQNKKNLFDWLDQEQETSLQQCDAHESLVVLNDSFEMECEMNRNPAEFSPTEPRNPYMKDKKNNKEAKGHKKSHGSSFNQNMKLKKL
uniref:Uncharacterized protein n=1 Tax=Cajanus cajan TaxID=3821 RepID=A0A151RGG6_CAJCA|nr:hypothetical protein KK1_036927 [Cajanus cajan]